MMLAHIDKLVNEFNVKGLTEGQERVSVPSDSFRALVRLVLDRIPFDEEWYLATYPDVAEAVRDGKVESGHRHFIQFGYFEGRTLCPANFDEQRYLDQYPDVKKGIDNGQIPSAKIHFAMSGYAEGRHAPIDPHPNAVPASERSKGTVNARDGGLFGGRRQVATA